MRWDCCFDPQGPYLIIRCESLEVIHLMINGKKPTLQEERRAIWMVRAFNKMEETEPIPEID